MDEMIPFAEFHLDVLREVGNIGAGHAATALSKLLNKTVEMQVPIVRMVPFAEISNSIGGPEQVVIAIYLRVEGETPGNIFFIMTQECTRKMLKNLVGIQIVNEDKYSDMELSALSEIGNILAGSYLTSLSDLTNLQLTPTVPSLAIDMAGAILNYGILEYGEMGDQALFIDTKLFDGVEEIEGHFFLIPDPQSFQKLFNALGVSLS